MVARKSDDSSFFKIRSGAKFFPDRICKSTNRPSGRVRVFPCPWGPANVKYFRLSRENGPKVELRREFRPFRMRRRHFKNCSSPNRTYQAAYPEPGWNDQTGKFLNSMTQVYDSLSVNSMSHTFRSSRGPLWIKISLRSVLHTKW